MAKPNGAVLYRGPSQLNGRPIVAIITGLQRTSKNPKTGDELQTYILADGVNPVAAADRGADRAVCGDCKHRKANLGSCYVTLIHGPNAVYKALVRRAYRAVRPDRLAALAAGRLVRLGTYGDPMAVPSHIWQALLSRSTGHTGYSHQWANPKLSTRQRSGIMSIVMASVDTPGEAGAARAAGYRYFRVRQAGDGLLPHEIVCPASAEASYRRTCATCKACNGGTSKTSIAIQVHGNGAKRFALQVVN